MGWVDALQTDDADAALAQDRKQTGDPIGIEGDGGEVENGRPFREEVGRGLGPPVQFTQPIGQRGGRREHEGHEGTAAKTDGLAGLYGICRGQGIAPGSDSYRAVNPIRRFGQLTIG